MEVREIKTLLALMQDYGLVELEIEDKKGKVRLVRAAPMCAGEHRRPAPALQNAATAFSCGPSRGVATRRSASNARQRAAPATRGEPDR